MDNVSSKTFIASKVLTYYQWLLVAKIADCALGKGIEAKVLREPETQPFLAEIMAAAKEYDKYEG